jgi:hypothetical protein
LVHSFFFFTVFLSFSVSVCDNYSGPQSHSFTSLLTESRVPTNPGPKSQVPTPRLGCLRSKSRTVKKTWRGPGGAQVCEIAGVSIKPGRWRSPISHEDPGPGP